MEPLYSLQDRWHGSGAATGQGVRRQRGPRPCGPAPSARASTFHNGATFDANDVVLSYAVQWDAEHPLHVGKADAGLFEYWTYLFAGFLNPPPPAP